MTGQVAEPDVLVPDDEVFERMSRTERRQHVLLAAAFAVLILTGLPDLLSRRPVAAVERGLVHRGAALVLAGGLVWHVLYTILSPRGRANFRERLPRRQDVLDGLALFGLRRGRPEPGRYSFVEKFDYWAFVFGSTLMIVTGFFMALPGLSLKLFPLWLHQAFVAVHGYEAVLAFVAIIVFHMYAAHLNPGVFPMSRVWLDGRMTGGEMRRSHPREYRRILEERRAEIKSIMSRE